MTDELKPELEDALKKLPRERMPAGLEARVTGAMRDHGFLGKRRRVVAITNARAAGLLAACVALVVGAYAVGLNRGGDQALAPSMTMERDAATPATSLPRDATKSKTDVVPEEENVQQDAVAEPELPPVSAAKPERVEPDKAADRSEIERAQDEKRADAPSAVTDETAETRTRQSRAMNLMEQEATVRGAPAAPAPDPNRYTLGASTVVVEAPDSVRIVDDERGRVLLIYTSDGVIRIRPAGLR